MIRQSPFKLRDPFSAARHDIDLIHSHAWFRNVSQILKIFVSQLLFKKNNLCISTNKAIKIDTKKLQQTRTGEEKESGWSVFVWKQWRESLWLVTYAFVCAFTFYSLPTKVPVFTSLVLHLRISGRSLHFLFSFKIYFLF